MRYSSQNALPSLRRSTQGNPESMLHCNMSLVGLANGRGTPQNAVETAFAVLQRPFLRIG